MAFQVDFRTVRIVPVLLLLLLSLVINSFTEASEFFKAVNKSASSTATCGEFGKTRSFLFLETKWGKKKKPLAYR